ncbi:MAG: hypothetical protein IT366_09060 [Candidatus Hydrogenedentes bacterium]|nr:hypothetical protein [Candidatus Hydrogenedentota bacterium]
MNAEVKAPYRAIPEDEDGWWGDESDMVQRVVEEANKQFSADQPNLLILTPTFRRSVFEGRGQLVRGLFGKEVIAFTIDNRTGAAIGEPWSEFRPDGPFLATKQKNGRWFKPSRQPRNTKVAAVLCIEERLNWNRCYFSGDHVFDESPFNRSWIEHDVLLAHNPHATHPIRQDIWGDIPQLIPQDGKMVWTDGHKVL